VTLAGTKIRRETLASVASNEELQRDLGQIPETQPIQNSMQMRRGNMDHMQMQNRG
jgi:hypothetical protein